MFSFFRRRNTGRAPQRHTAPRCRPTLEVLEDRTLMDGSLSALAVIGSGGGGGGQPPPPEVLEITAPLGQSGKVFLTLKFAQTFNGTVSATEQISFVFGKITVVYKAQDVNNENSLKESGKLFLESQFNQIFTEQISSIPGPAGLLVAADFISPAHSKGT
jgi:hypothetical protein